MKGIRQPAKPPLRQQPRKFPSLIRTLLVGSMAALLAAPLVAGSVSYTYDSLGRLKTATYSSGVVITYSYDAAGNRSSQVTTGAP